ncbi:MAG: DUF4386 domain-containing protein [Anaerolineaceae bacterium]|nr:DUF4386 domain-containing protein [Anaerolineaceae bacterium]
MPNLNNKTKARIAGILYLVIFIVYPLASFLGKSMIVVPGDAQATATNLLENGVLFRIGIAGEAIIFLVELILAGIFYELLKPVNTALSLASAFSRVVEAIIQAVNLLPSILALLLVSGGAYLTVFGPEQLNALLLLFMDSFNFMIIVWGFFFGFHLILMGYLVAKSDLFPKILGILLILGGAGYLLQSFGTFLVPQFESLLATIVLVLATPSELAFTLYLLIKGVRDQKVVQQSAS